MPEAQGDSTVTAPDATLEELRAALAPHLEVMNRLGQGGMGAVYLARDTALNRLVAVKVLAADLTHDESAKLRFSREAEATAALEHPNIVSVFQVGTLPTSRSPYIVMQYIDGKTLGDLFPHDQPAPNPVARRIVGEVASALAAAHASGLIHRDIKPSNVIVEARTGRAIVVDFGISAILERPSATSTSMSPKLTATGMYVGTPMYMAPEIGVGEPASASSDVYALGVLAFEMITGEPPFAGSTAMALLAAHMKDAPPSVMDKRTDADPELARLVDACLSKSKENRPAAEDVARFLLPTASAIEWPPPGLDALRGTGMRLTAALGTCAVGLWALFGAALFQSTRTMPCCWREAEGESLFGVIRTLLDLPMDYDEIALATVYEAVIVITLVAVPIMLFVLGRRAWTLGVELRRARAAGYPWDVALATAWDRRADTAALWNGTDMFALATEDERAHFLRLRRRDALFLNLTVIVALLLPVLWATGLMPKLGEQDRGMLAEREYVLLLAPILGLLIGAAVAQHPEQAFRQRARGKRTKSKAAAPVVRPEVVAGWLTQAKLSPAPTRMLIPRGVFPVAALLLVIPIAIALVVAMQAVLLVSRRIPQARAHIDSLPLASMRRDWAEMRALFDKYSSLPDWKDERAGLIPTGLMTDAWIERQRLRSDPALLARYPRDTVGTTHFDSHPTTDLRMWALLPNRLPNDARRRLLADTIIPALEYYRAFAHAPKPPLLSLLAPVADTGMFRSGDGPWIPQYPFSVLWDLRELNRSAAMLAIADGRNAEAVMRAKEDVAVVWHLYQSVPDVYLAHGVASLERVARAIKDSAMIRDADRMEALALSRNRFAQFPLLFADPMDSTGFALVSDTSLNPFTRVSALYSAIYGFCHSAREVLFGVDSRREKLLEEVGRRLPAGSQPVTNYIRRELRALLSDPQETARAVRPAGAFHPAALIGLGDARARMAICRRE